MADVLYRVEAEGSLCGAPVGRAKQGHRAVDEPSISPWGPTAGDPVDLSTGGETYEPAADLVVYCDTCEPVAFSRVWTNLLAMQQYGSPGLAKGWVHNFDLILQEAESTATWKPLELIYPDGALETCTPVLDGQGAPTGAFVVEAGVPYHLTGTASTTPGRWTELCLTYRDQTVLRLAYHAEDDVYVLARRDNRLGLGVTLTWDGGRRLQSVTDAQTQAVLLTASYDEAGLLTSWADRFGRKVDYTQGLLTGEGYSGYRTGLLAVSQIVPMDETEPPARWTYGYGEVDSLGFDPGPHYTHDYETWDTTLLLLGTIDTPSPTGVGQSRASLGYYSDGYRIARTTDANGIQRGYLYFSGYTTVDVFDADNHLLQTWQTAFNSDGSQTGSTAPGAPSYEYGNTSFPLQVTKVTGADGRETEMTYDSHGNLVSQTDARGTVIENTWDYTNFAFGRLTQVTRTPDGGPTRVVAAYTYDEPSGLVLTATTLEPGTTDGSTVTVSYTYDDLGNVLTVATPGNNAATTLTTTYEYETDGTYTTTAKVGQPIRVSCPGTCARHYRYDARGNRTLYTDALGSTWETVYNLADQVIVSYEPATGQQGTGRARRVMTYAWPGGPQTELTVLDEAGNVVQHINTEYGAEGERRAVTGGTEPVSYTYDGLYRVATLTDGNGHVTRYAYDANGRLALTRYPGATADTGADTLRQTSYDLAGRLLQRIDGNNLTCNFAYNEAGGALTNVSYPTQSSYNVTYGHDALGRVTSMSDAQGTIATTYDDLGNPLTVTTTYTGLDPQVVEYTYYPNGQRASMNTPGGLFEYEYSVNGQMTQLEGPAGTSSWTWLDNQQLGARTLPCGAWSEFTYLPNGRLSTLTNKDEQGTVMSRYLDLQYRGTGDLAHWEAQVTGSTSHSGETDYTYDSRRELTGEESERDSGYDDAYAYDNAGNPTSWRGATRTFNSDNQETTGANWTYDGNGNPTSYGGTTCTYDVANHLTGFGSEFTAGYRGDGLRAWQQSGTTRKYYLYDGWRPVCELDDAGTVLRSWTFGADGLVACGSEQALCDWQGNAAHLWDGSTWTLGAVLGGYGAAGAGYKWLHGYLGVSEDLILCTYRHLDPALGRWLTRDPIGYNGGIALYGYVGNRPIMLVDLQGLRCAEDWCEWVLSAMLGTALGTVGAIVGVAVTSASVVITLGTTVITIPLGAVAGATAGAGIGTAAGLSICDLLYQPAARKALFDAIQAWLDTWVPGPGQSAASAAALPGSR